MMRIASAAYALCAALLLSIGLFSSAPAGAGEYYGQRHGYHSNDRPYRSTYYGRPAYQSAHYGRPAYRSAHYGNPYRPYSRPSYSSYDNGYRNAGYDNGYRHTGYDNGRDTGYDNGYRNTGYRHTGYDNGYRNTGYDNGYQHTGYDNSYRYAGYDNGYSPHGCGRRTVYIPYGWSWYRSHDHRC